MKRAVIVALMLSMLLLASAAVATTITETGLSVVLSVGEDKRPIEALMNFTDKYGQQLSPSGATLVVPKDEPVYGQVFPKGVKNANDFKIGYTTNTLVANMKPADFDSIYGWRFTLSPEDTAQVGLVRALQLSLTDRKGKHPWFRIIFKVTDLFGTKSSTEYDQLIIKTIPRSEMSSSVAAVSNDRLNDLEDRMTKAEGHITTAEGNIKSIGTVVTAQTKEIRNLQDWVNRATSGTASMPTGTAVPTNNVAQTTTSSQMVTLPVSFTGNPVGVWMEITRPDGKTDTYDAKMVGQIVTLPCGVNSFDLWVDYGNGIVKKKKTIPVKIDQGTTSLLFDVSYQGGGRGR